MQFAAHARLFDWPDPRRIDLRASLAATPREWLVRSHYQRAAINIMAVVDVSPMMRFGTPRTKLAVAADFVESLCHSAYGSGDAVGLMAFDHRAVDELWLPPRHGRAMVSALSAPLRERATPMADAERANRKGDAREKLTQGLGTCLERLPARCELVFVVSDFHGSLDALPQLLDRLGDVLVVPLILWDPAETEPPPDGALLALRDMQGASARSLWLRHSVRQRWHSGVAERRQTLIALFKSRQLEPVFFEGRFEPERLTRYFMEHSA